MRKGLSVAMAVAGLIVSGSALAGLDLSQPGDSFWSVDWVLVVQVVAAISTAAAAVAAWMAASHSRAQTAQLTAQNRWQRYESHYLQFERLVSEVECVAEIKFIYCWPLYELLFPNNRDLSADFSQDADVATLDGWCDSFENLAKMTQKDPSRRIDSCGDWCKEVRRLASQMMVNLENPTVAQLRISEELFPLFVTTENSHLLLLRIETALNMLLEFGNHFRRVKLQGRGSRHSDFMRGLRSFLNECKRGRHTDFEYK